MRLSGVYVLRHTPSGAAYVGSSHDIHRRWRAHQQELIRGCHSNAGLQQAWASDGPQSFTVAVLEPIAPDSRSLLEAERKWWLWFVGANITMFSAAVPARNDMSRPCLPGLVLRRVRAGLAQRDLAERSGVAASTIARIETGHEAHPSTARRLAEALDCLPADLMEPS